MQPSTLSVQDLVRQTSRPNAAVVSMPIAGSERPIHAIEVDNACALTLWQECRALLQGTGYQAIVTCFWGMRYPTWSATLEAELPHAVSRFFFDEEVERGLAGMVSAEPGSIIESASQLDHDGLVQDYLRVLQVQANDIDWELERLDRLYGRAPEREALELSLLDDSTPAWVSFQRAAFEWERRNGLRPPSQPPVPWFEPTETMALLLLPVAEPEHLLAHLHWWGSSTLGSPTTIALLGRWRRDFGAQLACHFGTMLQLYVERPPTDADTAFQLAVELETVAPSGDIGELAWHLMETDRWFLHNRP